MNELKEAALKYAALGIAVFPLVPNNKQPLTANGFKDATTDPEKIEEWWSIHPDANVGIATGDMSGGLVAIDMDVDKDEGKDGYHTFLDWCNANYVILPDSWLSITGRGGYHLVYRSMFPVPSKIGWLKDVDIRANGGYIVAPPSIHPNGTRYEWEQDPSEYELITTDDIDVEYIMNSILSSNKSAGEPLKVPDEIPEGHRDELMFKLACKYQAMGMSDEAMLAALRIENETRCKPPLSDREIKKKVKQAQKYAKGEIVSITDNSETVAKRKTYGKTGRKIEEDITEHDMDMPTLEQFEEREKEWLVPGYIPKGCVTLLCSDGGIGKTTIWCDTLAAFTTGRTTIFDKALETPFHTGDVHDVMYFSKEDPTEEILKGKLREAGADQSHIRCFGLDDERLSKIWYGSLLLEKLVEKYKPDIVVFDTLQAFLPEGVDMAKRKDMRDALNPLNALGAKFGTSFLMVMHTNKSANSGRQRMADSSDIWDLGRSALMAGRTKEDNVCYLSHEKSNYGRLQRTILFSISETGVIFKGTSKKKDRDYVAEGTVSAAPTPKLDEARDFILENVDECIEVGELEKMAKAAGISKGTLENARAALKKDKLITIRSIGFGKDKKWMLYTTNKNEGGIR
jgi:hypothetical protein